jgi:hypothetical protein
MPSKFNTEFNYKYQVMGCTPWERIKILKGFLEGRVRAVALEEVAHLQHDSLVAEMAYLKTTGAPEHEQMRLQAKIVESASHMVIVDEAYELNRQEIEILNRLLAECYEMAEPTRIEGYTDEEMFEVNAAHEFAVVTMREMQSEIIANGRPTPATVLHAMNNPHVLAATLKAGLLPADAIPLLTGNAPIFGAQEMAAIKTSQKEMLMLADTEEQTIVDAPEEEEVVEEEAEEADDDQDDGEDEDAE